MQAGANRSLYRQTHEAMIEAISDFGIRAATFSSTGSNRIRHPARPQPDESGAVGPPSEPFLCFQRRTDDDLIASGYKVLGSRPAKGKTNGTPARQLAGAGQPACPSIAGNLGFRSDQRQGGPDCGQRRGPIVGSFIDRLESWIVDFGRARTSDRVGRRTIRSSDMVAAPMISSHSDGRVPGVGLSDL